MDDILRQYLYLLLALGLVLLERVLVRQPSSRS